MNSKQLLNSRIAERITALKTNPTQVSKQIGNDGYIRDIYRKKTTPRAENLMELAKVLETTPEYLLGLTDDVSLPPKKARAFSSFDPDAPDQPQHEERKTIGSETGVVGIPEGTLPQIDVTAGLGAGGLTIVEEGVMGRSGMTFAAEAIRDYWRIPSDVLRTPGGSTKDLIVLPVQGDSMTPTLQDGEWVVADTRHRVPSPDGVYALTDPFGGVIVKRLELASKPNDEDIQVRVISDNPKHAPKTWSMDEVRIIGRVIWRFGHLN